MKRSLILLAMTPVLIAQATPPASPPASTPTIPLSKRIDAETKRLDALKLTDPAQALAEALALVPDPIPAFDKSSIQATRQSVMDQLAIVQVKFMAGSCARECGKWEQATLLFKEAADLASAIKEPVKEGVAPSRKQWQDAVAVAKVKIAEVEPQVAAFDQNPRFVALGAKADRTMDENIEYEKFMAQKADLIQPLQVWKNNIEIAPKALAVFDDLEKAPDPYVEACMNNMQKMQKAIAAEKAELNRFDEDAKNPIINSKRLKPLAYFINQKIRQMTEQKVDRQLWLLNLNRYLVLDPGNKEVLKKIDWALGNSAPAKGKS
ncbi:MAG: hypothetical protein ACO219_04765 [Holophagaceae bacterium]